MGEEDFPEKKKAHQKRRAGGKADKKKGKTPHEQELTAKQKNPKAFAIQNVTKVRKVSFPVGDCCLKGLPHEMDLAFYG
jgi:hypothetical protein